MLRAAKDLKLNVNLLAINHWPVAINTHSLNHKNVRHKCESLDSIRPREAVPGGRLGLLTASPECTHHSVAAGGRPKNDQSRATAWHVCRWASDLTIDSILIENVAEFQSWGPLGLDGKPLKKRKGETFKAFINALVSMGYRVEYRVQNAATFGDPTSRKRLLIMARRGGGEITWPNASHGQDLKPFRTAREVIDWDLKGNSIFGRKRPLSPNTMRRIAAGLKKFGGPAAEPFLVMLYGTNKARSVDRPMPTVTAGGNHIAVAQPFILPHPRTKGDGPRSVDSPLQTVTATSCDMQLCEPFLIPYHSGKGREDERAHSVNEPMRTQDTQNRHALVEPFLMHLTHHGADASRCHSQDLPVPTITGAHRAEIALVEPFLAQIDQHGSNGACVHGINGQVPTICTKANIALVEPFVLKYYGTGISKSVNQPLDTISTKDRFLLVDPVTGNTVAELDIRLRMLQPHELAAAMSFPKDYAFYGNREQQVKQIGNAVPVELSRAHCGALLKSIMM